MSSARGAEAIEALAERAERPIWVEWPRAALTFARRKPLGALGGLIVVAMIFMAIITATPFAGLVAPYRYDQPDFTSLLEKPSLDHLFGTDQIGRDVLSRVVYGARVSVFVGFGAIGIATVLATTLGMLSGYYGGKLDASLERFIDIWMSFPALVLLLSILAITGPGLTQIIIAIGLRFAAGTSRIARSAVLAMKNNVYMDAAKAVGAGDLRILSLYVLPNIFPTILVIATAQLGFAILTEASLSFLGYGVPPPRPAWGSMLSGDVQQAFILGPWLAIAPGLAIALAVYGFNMFGDALRDVLDPRMRGSR